MSPPNLEGQPWLFAANGEPRLSHTIDGREMQFEAAERIHLVRLGEHLDPWLPGNTWTRKLAPGATQLLIFHGASSLTLPHEDSTLTVRADQGLRVLRGESAEDPFTVLGRGKVALTSDGGASPLALNGNQGFLLHVDAGSQKLRLGPADATAAHRFKVQTEQLEVAGSGSCRMLRPANPARPGRIVMTSPSDDLDLVMRDTAGALHRVGTLDATFDATGLLNFDATGKACQLDWQGERDVLAGQAKHIWSNDPTTFFLEGVEGAPAVLDSQRGGTLTGEHIRIVRLFGEEVLLDARRGAHLVADQLQARDGKSLEGGLDLFADRILYLPFLRPGIAELGWPHAGIPLLPRPSSTAPHLVARGRVIVHQLSEAGDSISKAHGDSLVLELSGEPIGRLEGHPAILTRRDSAGQTITGEAARIVFAAESERLLLEPEGQRVRFLVGNRQGDLAQFGDSDGATLVLCDGPVEADGRTIWFRGWVDARSVDAAGVVEPRGFQLQTTGMKMVRDPRVRSDRGRLRPRWCRAGLARHRGAGGRAPPGSPAAGVHGARSQRHRQGVAAQRLLRRLLASAVQLSHL